MLDLKKVDRIVKKVAASTLKGKVLRVRSEPMVDSMGREALRVWIVIGPGSFDEVVGEMSLATLMGVSDALLAADDERFPHIRYRTEAEMASVDDTEC